VRFYIHFSLCDFYSKNCLESLKTIKNIVLTPKSKNVHPFVWKPPTVIWWPQKINNQKLWEKTVGQSKIDVKIKRRKYGWIGHTLRKSKNEVCHSVLEWNPQGRRSRGRPKATWRRTVLVECGKKSFGELRAQASHRWKLKTDGLCSTGVWL
jgi:hypothetical protein